MSLRLLCLHGWGTNIKIFQTQLQSLIKDLHRDNTATFHLIEGDIESVPGPGIEPYFDGPYYSYYQFPRTFANPDPEGESILDAYNYLDEVIADEGPFDGILGFSQGGTLAAGYLIHHAKRLRQQQQQQQQHQTLPFRCAIFINSLPPFRMHHPSPDAEPIIDDDLEGYIKIPTLSIAGLQDPLLPYSLALHRLCDERNSNWVVHTKGHDIPSDKVNVTAMATAIRKLAVQVAMNW